LLHRNDSRLQNLKIAAAAERERERESLAEDRDGIVTYQAKAH
jgi:hypothetical protein